MSKYRTAFQDFTFIKGLIDNKKTINFVVEARKEGITFWGLHNIFRKFILSNYLSLDRSKKQKTIISNLLASNGHYPVGYEAQRCSRVLKSKDMNLSSKQFKVTTYKKAITQLTEIAEIRNKLIEEINLHCKNDTTYSVAFEGLCEKYNLKPSLERARRKEEYSLTVPVYVLEKRKAKKEKTEKEKLERFQREEKRKNALIVEKAKNERIFTITDVKSSIKYLKNLSKTHYKGRNYTQESIAELKLLDCLTLSNYDNQKVSNKIQELQNSIQ